MWVYKSVKNTQHHLICIFIIVQSFFAMITQQFLAFVIPPTQKKKLVNLMHMCNISNPDKSLIWT